MSRMEEQRTHHIAEVDDQKPVTKKVLVETLHEFRKAVQKDTYAAIDEHVPRIIDEHVPRIIDEHVPRIIDEHVPRILGRFTDDVLMPSIVTLIREEIAGTEHRIKAYLDSKVADLRGDRELFRKFMEKLTEILRRHRYASESEIEELTRLIPVR